MTRKDTWPNKKELGYYWNKIPGADRAAIPAMEGTDPPPEDGKRRQKRRKKRGRPRSI